METDEPVFVDGGSHTDHGANSEQSSSSTRPGEVTSERRPGLDKDPSTETETPRVDEDVSVDLLPGIQASINDQDIKVNLPDAEEILIADPNNTHGNESDPRHASKTPEPLLSSLTPEQRSASLWAAAYSSLYYEDSELVAYFESIVSRWLAAKGYKDPSTLRDPDSGSTSTYRRFLKGPLYTVFTHFLENSCAPQEIMLESSPTTKRSTDEAPRSPVGASSPQNERILTDNYTKDTDSESSDHVGQPSEPDQFSPSYHRDRQASTTPDVEEPGSGSDNTQSLRQIFQGAVQSCPHACLAWTVAYILSEILAAQRSQTSEARSYRQSITKTIAKIEWFSQLFKLLWWPGDAKPRKSTKSHHVKALADLYKSVLLFLLRAATHCDPESPRGRLDFDESTLGPIPNEKPFVSNFDEISPTHRLEEFLALEMSKEPNTSSNSDVERAIAKLHIDRLPPTPSDSRQRDMLRSVKDWVSERSEFKAFIDWSDTLRCRVLWVEGIPGTGKSMLLRTAVDYLATAAPSHNETKRQVISFFCDDTKWRQGTVLSAVKTLISDLLVNQPELLDHLDPLLHETVDFRADDSVPLLCRVLLRMVQDEKFCPTYVILDGLEQFTPDVDQRVPGRYTAGKSAINPDRPAAQALKNLIAATIKLSDRIKWLVSTEPGYCNDPLDFGSGLTSNNLESRLSLSKGMSGLVEGYATQRITSLIDESDTDGLIRAAVSRRLRDVPVNFLWINLAVDMLRTSSTPWSLPDLLHKFVQESQTVYELFQINYDLVCLQQSKDRSYCEYLLRTAATAYRPLPTSELVAIIKLPKVVQLSVLIPRLLPAFLEISEDRVCFKHLSARIFAQNIMRGERNATFEYHCTLAKYCLETILGRIGCTHSEASSEVCTAEPREGYEYTWSIWPRHLSEIYGKVAQATEVTRLAEHLLTVHLMRWLQFLATEKLLHEAVSTMLCLANVAELALFTEAHALMSVYYDEWLSQEKSMTGNSIEAADERMKHELLFSNEYPDLGRRIRPILFPHLKNLFQTGSAVVPIRQFAHSDWLRGCCFSPDGNLVVSASDEAYIRLWDTRSWKLQDIMGKYDEYALEVFMSKAPSMPENIFGNLLLAAFDKKHIRLWNVGTGALLKTLSSTDVDSKGESSKYSDCDIESIALAPEGDLLAAVVGGDLVLWSLPEASDGRVLDKGVNSPLRRIVFAPRKKLLAASFSNQIRIWDLEDGTGRLVCSLPEETKVDTPENGPVGEMNTVENSSGTEDAGNSAGGAKAVTSTGSGDDVAIEPPENADTKEETGEVAIHWLSTAHRDTSPDTESTEHSSDMILNSTGHSDYIDGLAFSFDSKFLVSGSDDTTARIWDIEKGRSICTLAFDSSPINSVGFSGDGSRLVTGSQNGTMAIWTPSSLNSWEASEGRTRPEQVFFEHNRGVSMLSFSPDEHNRDLIASSSYDGCLQICRVCRFKSDSCTCESESPGTQVKGHREPVVSVAVSASGNMVATASRPGDILLWTIVSEHGQCSIVPHGEGTGFHHKAYVSTMVFSPDEKMMTTGASDGKAVVWVISAFGLTPTLLLEHSNWVQAIQFSPNGQMLATGEDDGTVRLFSLPNGLADGKFEPPDKQPLKQDSVAADVYRDKPGEPPKPSDLPSPSGPFPWEPMRTLDKHTDFVRGVAFSPDSKTLASCGHDEHVLIWSVEEEEAEKALLHNMHDSDKGFVRLYSVVFVMEGTKVLSCSHGGKIALWDPDAEEGAWCRILQENDVDAYRSMRIDPELPNFLFTEVGAVRYSLHGGEGAEKRSFEENDRPPIWPLLRTDWQKSEIIWGKGENEETITLPSWLRLRGPALCYCVSRNKVIVGCLTGQILVFEFSDDIEPSLND